MMMMASVSGVNGHKKSEKISQIQKCVTGSEFTQQRVHTPTTHMDLANLLVLF